MGINKDGTSKEKPIALAGQAASARPGRFQHQFQIQSQEETWAIQANCRKEASSQPGPKGARGRLPGSAIGRLARHRQESRKKDKGPQREQGAQQ